ncbi:MAG: hypothetical protein PHH68_04550 [Candidatus Omnitrophica bacterium]|jgi:hypothetical protein|nr:hypothetical protein [Candidatus Omnitrophota bacterium]MDD5079580.1 hypothetical protein [Candidatus Omnitrophota bacterium]
MSFMLGRTYTRQEIRDLAGGGSVQDYLPNENGKVLYACLSQKYGPGIPKVVLVGQGPGVQQQAEIFWQQKSAVPVFFKKAANLWEYAGNFRPVNSTDDPDSIAEFAESSGRMILTRIIFLEEDK